MIDEGGLMMDEGGLMMDRRRKRGFSIIELMIAMVILGVVTTGVLGVFSSQQQGYIGQKRMLDAQGDARLVGDMIFADVRMAGFMIPTIAGITTGDGGTTGSDRLCVSDSTIMDEAILEDATVRFGGGSFTNDLGAGDGRITISAAERDLDGDGNEDFSAGSGIIIADGTKSHCARITSISSGKLNFAPDTPTGFAAPSATGVAVPAIVYELSGTNLTRNGLLLSPQVEDLQIEFWVDVNGDGVMDMPAEAPIHDLDGYDTRQIRAVRLYVLARTTIEDQDLAAVGTPRPAVANHAAASVSDAFRRRLVWVTAAPRNML